MPVKLHVDYMDCQHNYTSIMSISGYANIGSKHDMGKRIRSSM